MTFANAFKKFLATGEIETMDETLAEHDKKHHPYGYREGDSCNKREGMAKLDRVDDLGLSDNWKRELPQYSELPQYGEDWSKKWKIAAEQAKERLQGNDAEPMRGVKVIDWKPIPSNMSDEERKKFADEWRMVQLDWLERGREEHERYETERLAQLDENDLPLSLQNPYIRRDGKIGMGYEQLKKMEEWERNHKHEIEEWKRKVRKAKAKVKAERRRNANKTYGNSSRDDSWHLDMVGNRMMVDDPAFAKEK